MISRLSSTALAELIPLLGSLARLLARGTSLTDQELQMLLMGVDLEHDPAALAEIQRWSRLLGVLQAQPTPMVRQVTVETLRLRGVPEATALLAIATIADSVVVPVSPPESANPVRLHVRPARLEFGTLAHDQPVAGDLEIQGGPGQIVVESDYVRVTPTQFAGGTTCVHVEAQPLAGGLLWTALKLVTAGETVEVPVMAQWAAASSPQASTVMDPSVQPLPGSGATPETPTMVPPAQKSADPGAELVRAINDAPAGAVIRIKAGEYLLPQPLVVNKPITLTGEGMNRTRLLCAAEAYVAHFVGNGPFVVANLSFEHTGTAWAHVVQVTGGEIDLQHCRFRGGMFDAVGQRGGCGLYLRTQTYGMVRRCEALGNVTYGMSVSEQAQPTLEANTCHENKYSGIVYCGCAGGTAHQNSCASNGRCGIYVEEQAQPRLEANICQQNTMHGIACFDAAMGVVLQNVCTANGQCGIHVGGQAQPTLEANACRGNGGDGIILADTAAPSLSGNHCSGNGGRQIHDQRKKFRKL